MNSEREERKMRRRDRGAWTLIHSIWLPVRESGPAATSQDEIVDTSGRHHIAGAVSAIAALAIGAGLLVTTALATPPGKNGVIAFTRYADANRSSGSIYVINTNGKGERRVTKAPAG